MFSTYVNTCTLQIKTTENALIFVLLKFAKASSFWKKEIIWGNSVSKGIKSYIFVTTNLVCDELSNSR